MLPEVKVSDGAEPSCDGRLITNSKCRSIIAISATAVSTNIVKEEFIIWQTSRGAMLCRMREGFLLFYKRMLTTQRTSLIKPHPLVVGPFYDTAHPFKTRTIPKTPDVIQTKQMNGWLASSRFTFPNASPFCRRRFG